ncbi:glycosyltransferase family 4 protein [Phenylobacterium sp.]|uniref:glycosyltransferase family 4 protein n=1 Tax=Phenylobacterium sp. TaxID=1871053 RepID=UPI0025F53372|nr:glycosyltransferase family 4 protein [Phenylobacterium sp.]
MANAAIRLALEAYDGSRPRPMGRHAAGEGFLRGFLRYGDVDRFHLWNALDEDPAALEALVSRLGGVGRPVSWLGRGDRAALGYTGGVHIPTPELRAEAWARHAFGATAYSITGVTHTIASTHILDEISALLSAPLEPWDALVCTSDSVRKATENLLESSAAYLQERFGASRLPAVQLATIPLGVHTDDFRQDPGSRNRWRARLDIPADAPVVLYSGRLSIGTKMHPAPMALALQAAAQTLGRPIYWLVYGSGLSSDDETAWREAAAAFGPELLIREAPDSLVSTRNEILSAADVFLSLSDNVQETFGLTPVEAMAAGLPCIVSDWDGYRDTVRHGVDGYRIRTVAPRPGLGGDLIYAYDQRLIGYGTYAAATSLFTAVDIGDTAQALSRLLADPGLRTRMGEAGRERARGTFDWRVVIPQYQALWAELARRRQAVPAQTGQEHPHRPDPFRMFSAYPSAILGPADIVALVEAPEAVAARLANPSARVEAARLPSPAEAMALLETLRNGPRTVGELLATTPAERRPFAERGLAWLAKFGAVRLCDPTSRT